jgi:hypothetical protein
MPQASVNEARKFSEPSAETIHKDGNVLGCDVV